MAQFASGAYNFSFPSGRLLPYTDELIINQNRYLTEDMHAKTYQKLGKARIFNLQFVNLTHAETVELFTFFKDINYSGSELTFYDDNGNDWDGYLWQDSLKIQRKMNLKFDVSLTLISRVTSTNVGMHT